MLKQSINYFLILIIIIKINSSFPEERQLSSTLVTETTVSHVNPFIINLKTYGFVIAWYTTLSDIRFQVFNGDGIKVGNNVIAYSTGLQSRLVSGTSLPDGYFILSFFDASALVFRIFKYDYLGNYQTDVNYDESNSIKWTSSTTLTDGNFVAVYLESSNRYNMFSMYASTMTMRWSSKCPTTTSTRNRIESEGLLNGDYILVYDEKIPGSNFDIYGVIYNDIGTKVKEEFLINSLTNNDQVNARVAALSNGGFVVVFYSNYSSSMQVVARIFKSDYLSLGVEFPVNTILNSNSHYPKIMGLQTGGFIVLFLNTPASVREVYGREFDSDGQPITTPEYLAITYSNGSQDQPNINYINNNEIIILTRNPDSKQIRFEKYNDIIPTCANFTQNITKDVPTLINFTGKINSTQQTPSTLKILILTLPSHGILKNSNDDSLITTNMVIANNLIKYFPDTSTPVTFTYLSKDNYNRQATGSCTLTLTVCYNSCDSCSQIGDDLNHYCTTCKLNYYPLQDDTSKCYTSSTSLDGYFFNSSNFSKCISNCKTCNASSTCSVCNENFYLHSIEKSCYSKCPNGYYNDTTNKTCGNCVSNCKICEDNVECTECNDGFNLHNLVDGLCYATCPDNYFKNNNSTPKTCDPCLQNCKICPNQSECSTCQTNFYLHYLGDKLCYNTCPNEYFPNSTTKNCEQCPSNCFICNEGLCNTCKNDYYLKDNQCLSNCPDTFFNDVPTRSCKVCSENCKKCPDGTQCTVCIDNYYLFLGDNKCYAICPDKYFGNSTTKQCESCISNCLKCPNSSECSKCDLNYFVHSYVNKLCYDKCPLKFFDNITDGICDQCPDNCEKCFSRLKCTLCSMDFFLFNELCWSDCPTSYYGDIPTRTCMKCPDNCSICRNPSVCDYCNLGSYLFKGDYKCYLECPRGYLRNDKTRICETCPPNCSKCSSGTECSLCNDEYFLHPLEKICYKTCPIGYYGNYDTKFCVPCMDNCSKCSNSYECEFCNESFFLDSWLKTCSVSCSDQYFKDYTKRICVSCPDNCRNCNNDKECNVCMDDYFIYLKSKQCVKECPYGYFQDIKLKQCKECHESCGTCSGPGDKECVLCPLGMNNNAGKCILACSEREFLNPSTMKCIPLENFVSIFSIDVQDEIDLEVVDKLIVNLILKLNESFTLSSNLIMEIKWSDIYNGELSNSNKTLKIDTKTMGDGVYPFSANLILSGINLRKVSKEVRFRYYKLIPVVSNVTNLEIGKPIILDASQSYDEKDIGSNVDLEKEPINFSWICPGKLESLCSTFDQNTFSLSYKDYKEFVEENGNIFHIRLVLSRESKSNYFDYQIALSEKSDDDKNLFGISQKTKGILNEDIIFEIFFFSGDNPYKSEDFSYYWTIPNFIESNYLNSRREKTLRVRFSDINSQMFNIQIDMTNKENGQKLTKIFPYQNIILPMGKCKIDPPSGISGLTKFNVTAIDWSSKNEPLKYSFYYENDFSLKILIKQFVTTSFVSMLPFGNNFYLETTDSLGYVSSVPCPVQMFKNKKLQSLKNEFLTQEDKFIEYEVYYSNMKEKFYTGYELFKFIDAMNFINDLFSRTTVVDSNIEKIISLVNIMNACEKDLKDENNIKDFNKLLIKIADKSNVISRNRNLLNPWLSVVDKNLFRFYEIDEKISNVDILQKNHDKWEAMIKSVYSTMVDGEDLIFSTAINRLAISKISSINTETIKLMTGDGENGNIMRIRPMFELSGNKTYLGECGYAVESDVCINRQELIDKLDLFNQSSIGLKIKVNKNPLKPNQTQESKVFSLNGIEVNLLGIEIDNINVTRYLQSEEQYYYDSSHIGYQSYLNIDPYLSEDDFNTKTESSTCVSYDNNFKPNATSCKSWYDFKTKVVLCNCSESGLVLNMFDKQLALLSKESQFTKAKFGLFNSYSMGIIFSLILLISVLYILGNYFDFSHGRAGKFKLYKYYDITQKRIVEFTRHGFSKRINIFRLYIYMIKVLHPLFSIFFIYSPYYNRGLRLFDLYLEIKLTFLFSLIPYHITINYDFEKVKSRRSVSDMNKSAGDLGVALAQIALSYTYTIIATIVSLVLTNLLKSIYFEDVKDTELKEKSHTMKKYLMKIKNNELHGYKAKLHKAYYKVVTLCKLYNSWQKFKFQNKIEQKEIMTKNNNCNIEISIKNYSTQHQQIEKKAITNIKENENIYVRKKIENPRIHFNSINTKTQRIVKKKNPLYFKINSFNLFFEGNFFGNKNKITNYLTPISYHPYILKKKGMKEQIYAISFQVIDAKSLSKKLKKKQKKSNKKFLAYLILFTSLWMYLFYVITDVYNKYEQNMYQISVSPLVTTMLIQYLFTKNMMIFIFTVLMHLLGERVYNDNRKRWTPLHLLFKYYIPRQAKENHKAILTFNKLMRTIENEDKT